MTEDEFATFVASATPRLRNMAWSLCRNESDAEDLVQVTFEKLYRRWTSAEPDDPFAYARTVLVRSHVSARRRMRWSREVISGAEPTPGSMDPPLEDRQMLISALRRLPVRQRHAVVLRYLEDMTIPAVAEVMRCSEGNVKRLAHDGLASLRATFKMIDESAEAPSEC